MNATLIQNATIVNEGRLLVGSVLIIEEKISRIIEHKIDAIPSIDLPAVTKVIDAKGKYLLPGAIDDQVHFREPGLTHKATIKSESRSALAGGVTSFMEMPNTIPNVFNQDLLQDKFNIAEKDAYVNFSFFMGASNDNLEQVLLTDPKKVCGVKIFMGSSTGNMLVDNKATLESLFRKTQMLIAVHCEDEATIKANLQLAKTKFGEAIPPYYHPLIRNTDACYRSSSFAVELAKKYSTKLHVLHISTAKEIQLFDAGPLQNKHITAEACVHHLWFCDEDYESLGNRIKWNPAIKSAVDRDAIWEGLLTDKIDVIATDHAPHTLEEKNSPYLSAPSGGPLVQHALVAMLEFYHQKKISLTKIVEKMSHAPASLFQIDKRGYIRENYFADLVLVDLNNPWIVESSNILAKCGWSPFESVKFQSKVILTFVNGHLAYNNGSFDENHRGKRLEFNR